MSSEYHALLDATIAHLEDLKRQGVRHVTLDASTLEGLKAAPATASRSLAPAPPAPVRPAYTPPPRPAAPAPVPVRRPEISSVAPAAPTATTPEPAFAGPALAPEAKEAAMADLRTRALVCQKCPSLATTRTQVVFGVGNIHSDIMFVGEAPGRDEDLQGEPFVGAAGQLLTRIIQAMGYGRPDIYIGNVLKCRPDTPGKSYGNRKPTLEEMKTCLPYLLAQIDIIRPKVMVALGGTALEGLFGKPLPITRLRGQWQNFRGIPVMPTFHPSYLLRFEDPVAANAEKRKVWEDMLLVLEKLERPVTAKQRGFFLKPPVG